MTAGIKYPRIRDIENYEGDVSAFANLSDAIWELASDDEYRHLRFVLFSDIVEKTFDELLKYNKSDKDTSVKIKRIINKKYGNDGAKFIHKLEVAIDQHKPQLKNISQNKVYEESNNWPCNIKDKNFFDYAKDYKKIKEDILRIVR